jgi:hypothetical protein
MALKPAHNVVALYGICVNAPDGKLRVVMELCTHGSVRDFVRSTSPSKVCNRVCVALLGIMCEHGW